MSHSKIVPLTTDIEKISIGHYLETSHYERVVIRNGFGSIWQQFYEYTKNNRGIITIGYNHKPWDCKDTLILLVKRLYETERDLLNKILYHTFKGFIEWNFNEIEMDDIFEDLVLIEFPNDWLQDLKERFLVKKKMISKQKELETINDELENDLKIKESEVLTAYKSEWLRLVEFSNLGEAIGQMLEFCKRNKKDSIRNELINQSSRFYRIKEKYREGVIDIDTENLEVNKINKAVLEIIDKIE